MELRNGTLNMTEYFSNNLLVHTHIQKTGGTSLVFGLKSIFGKEHVVDLTETKRRPREMSKEELREIWALSGHFWFDTQERPIARRKRYILNLRDPVDRFVSLYNFVARAKSHPGHAKFGVRDVEGAFDYLKENMPTVVSNSVCNMFGDRTAKSPARRPGEPTARERLGTFEEALDKMERHYVLVIPMERVDDAIRGIGAAFGVNLSSVKRRNIGVKTVTAVPDRVRRELQQLNTEDYKLMAHFTESFDRQLEQLPARLVA